MKFQPNHPSCKKICSQDLIKGSDEKDVKSRGVAKACALMLLITLKTFNDSTGQKLTWKSKGLSTCNI